MADQPPYAGSVQTLTIRNVHYSFRWCPEGSFLMGCTPGECKQYNSEPDETDFACMDIPFFPSFSRDCVAARAPWNLYGGPGRVNRRLGASSDECFSECGVRRERIVNGFWMLETPVTEKMWKSIMPKSWGYQEGEDLPIDCVSYGDANRFCRKLNFLANFPENAIHLPTESQWEYACRAGTRTPYSFGTRATEEDANFCAQGRDGASPVGQTEPRRTPVRHYRANGWGIYDMHGNVSEWCQGPSFFNFVSGVRHQVLRGGNYADREGDIRSASRAFAPFQSRDFGLGFRVVWE
ncbi:MAG: formylglycine-generating enzyme family protein [Planctomycetia bacterium]|nr:formylglycine-generating enzyme family protein [Planctomycetia bacterium]